MADKSLGRNKSYRSGSMFQQQAVETICSALEDYLSTEWNHDFSPKAAGIGVIGRVTPSDGIWHQIDKDRNISIDLTGTISSRFGFSCFADNDVKSATRAEQLWGIGRKTSDFIYINIGTGIASGAVCGGRLVRGASSNAGETGHTSAVKDKWTYRQVRHLWNHEDQPRPSVCRSARSSGSRCPELSGDCLDSWRQDYVIAG